jgi:hypothetical protein
MEPQERFRIDAGLDESPGAPGARDRLHRFLAEAFGGGRVRSEVEDACDRDGLTHRPTYLGLPHRHRTSLEVSDSGADARGAEERIQLVCIERARRDTPR